MKKGANMKTNKPVKDYNAENERRRKAVDKANEFNKDELLSDGAEQGIPPQNKQTQIEKSVED